jgi:hypothetical protein
LLGAKHLPIFFLIFLLLLTPPPPPQKQSSDHNILLCEVLRLSWWCSWRPKFAATQCSITGSPVPSILKEQFLHFEQSSGLKALDPYSRNDPQHFASFVPVQCSILAHVCLRSLFCLVFKSTLQMVLFPTSHKSKWS